MGGKRVARLPRAGRVGREHARHVRERRLRRRPRDRARRSAGAGSFPSRSTRPRRSRRRASTTIEALAEFLGIDAAATSKAMPVVRATARSCSRSCAATTGSRRRSSRPCSRRRPARDRGRDPHGLRRRPGSLGPVGFAGEVVADETLREGQFVAGANRTGWHLRGVEHGRDFEAHFADIRQSQEGDACPSAAARLRFQTAIEVGHIFKLGTNYSVPLEATYPRRKRQGAANRRWGRTASVPVA